MHRRYRSLPALSLALCLAGSALSAEEQLLNKLSNNTPSDLIAQEVPGSPGMAPPASPEIQMQEGPGKTILINFNNVNVVEFIRFLSRVSGKNFVFDEEDLQFQITIVSEEPTSIENVMAALLQELRVHNLNLTEQGNNIIIHKNAAVNGISRVVSDTLVDKGGTEIVTRLFRLNTADSEKIATLIRPLMSEQALAEVLKDTNHLIVTDIATNVEQISNLVKSLDSPNNGLVIGQYVVRRGFIDSLIQLGQQIMSPISLNQTLIFVPHRAANSIFVVSTPFLMDRTLALLQYLDQTQGITRIFDLKDLKFSPEAEGAVQPPTLGGRQGQWQLDPNGNWVFRPLQEPGVPSTGIPPEGFWTVDDQGNWRFQQGRRPTMPSGTTGVAGPEGQWRLDPQGIWVFQLAPGRSISPERLLRPTPGTADLPLGHIERTRFHIYKLQYRKAPDVQIALGRIGIALRQGVGTNNDLIEALDSMQLIESSNSLIFTGTVEAIEKVRELIAEIDMPLRQIFLEMLILETTIDDALNYGVDWGTRFGGCDTAGSQAFLAPASPLPIGLDTTAIGVIPDAGGLAVRPGFSLGLIGRNVTHCGLAFQSLGALVRAVHNRGKTDVITNPKILTEDNYPAEIFVGVNVAFPTQSIVNDRGEIITQNFEFRDVGTRLRVTPLIGDNDIITLTIDEEVSTLAPALQVLATTGGPTTRKSRSTTKVHLPNEFFLVMSGMMQDEDTHTRSQVPCLGGIPFIGAAFSDIVHNDSRRNILIFIRPRIVDSVEEIDNVTKHQQDVWKYKRNIKKMWKYETDEALDFLNLPKCEECCEYEEEENQSCECDY